MNHFMSLCLICLSVKWGDASFFLSAIVSLSPQPQVAQLKPLAQHRTICCCLGSSNQQGAHPHGPCTVHHELGGRDISCRVFAQHSAPAALGQDREPSGAPEIVGCCLRKSSLVLRQSRHFPCWKSLRMVVSWLIYLVAMSKN